METEVTPFPHQKKTDEGFIKWFIGRYLVITKTEQRILVILCSLFFLGIALLMVSSQENIIKEKPATTEY